MDNLVVSSAFMLVSLGMSCRAYVVTAGSLQEDGGGRWSFNLSGPDFSFVGTALNREPPCSFATLAPCVEGTTVAIDDGFSPESGGVTASLTVSGVTYSFMELPGSNLGCCMDIHYTLSIPSTAPDDITLTAPFTMAGAVGGALCFPGVEGCVIPPTFFDATGTATVQLYKISPNEFRLQSAVYNFGPAVPEPGTLTLSITAIAILCCWKRWRNALV
jgi:hypothetical protein